MGCATGSIDSRLLWNVGYLSTWPIGSDLGGRINAKEAAMLGAGWDTVRLFLHVLAATVWVGGQLTLAALVPVLRRQGPEAPRAAARRFNLVAWPAYGVLIVTGIWNIAAVSPMTAAYRNTLILKLVVVAASGITAVLHARSKSTVGLAVWGALTGLTALAALFLGVLLVG
jgi:putative copper export protein